MPIDPSGWNAAEPADSEYRSLLSFLGDHPSTAYRPGELLGVIAGEAATDLDRQRCKTLLETLVELGKVDKRRDPDTDQYYYRIGSQVLDDRSTAAADTGPEDAAREAEDEDGSASGEDRSASEEDPVAPGTGGN